MGPAADAIAAAAALTALPISVVAIIVARRAERNSRRADLLAELRDRWDGAAELGSNPSPEELVTARNLLSNTQQLWEQGDDRMREIARERYGNAWQTLYLQLKRAGALTGPAGEELREFYENEIGKARHTR
jgi:hypothetical protein